ncbi:MAG: N-6 DNA methylase, partial [Anaerolineae bacterium]
MSPVPATVVDLIERYAHNADRYRRSDYNETQVRREFIDPLFEALGWDVGNRAGRAPQYQEVVHEATLRMGARGGVHAPDYAFRVGPQVVYYVEAKKPSVDIHADPSPAYQLRRYAWTAKLPLSVLTDFQELAIYDCRFRPAPADPAGQARVIYTRFEEYADRWDELTGILGHEAVLRGDLDRWADSNKAKRGTQAVDEAFLGEIEGWRTLLAQNVALRNPQIAGVRDLNYAVQKIIDRIIFLRICEDRGIEPYGQLRDALTGHDIYPRLLTLFRRADDRYNSGLFHFASAVHSACGETADTLTPALSIDDRALKEIIDDLYYPTSPYEFSVLGADILGNVYEQFLGSVIRLTPAHRAVVEQKPEVRKAGGVYYTPRYIVDYIVEHTVGALLEGKTPAQAARLRILDPACGSGSFLLGAYDYLLRWHLEWYTSHETRQARRETYQGPGGE